jgi:flagellar motor switch protein FliN
MTEDSDNSQQNDPQLPGGEEPEAEGDGVDELEPEEHLGEQLDEPSDQSGVEEALQAWREGGHVSEDLDDGDEIQLVQLPQLDPGGAPKTERRPQRLHNVEVDVTVELGRTSMTVRELSKLKEQDTIEISKLAGESFEIRVNGRLFAFGEVVVVTDLMGVRITNLIERPDSSDSEPVG